MDQRICTKFVHFVFYYAAVQNKNKTTLPSKQQTQILTCFVTLLFPDDFPRFGKDAYYLDRVYVSKLCFSFNQKMAHVEIAGKLCMPHTLFINF